MANNIDFNVNSNAVTVLNQTGAAAENTAKGFSSAKAELRALQQQLLSMDGTSEEFKKASARAAELKDNISDLSAEINANAGNAFEGLANNASLFGSRLMSLDLKGAGTALTGMATAIRGISFATLSQEIGGLTKGILAMGKALLANPIFLLAGVLIAVIAYWEELSDFVTGKSKMLANLKQQAETLKSQEEALSRQIALQKALGAGAAQMLKAELDMLKNKQQQAEVAMKIAYQEKNREAFLAAQQQQLQAINDLEIRRVKIHQDAQALLDKIRAAKDDEYNKQLLQNQAFAEYKRVTEELTVDQQINNQRAKEVNNEIANAQRAGNKALEEKLKLEKLSLYNQNVSIQNNKDEIWNAGMAAKDEVKTAAELERIEKRKAESSKRKTDAEAASKKLKEEVAAIEKEMAEFNRSGMSSVEYEIYQAEEKYKVQLEVFKRAKKSKEEIEQLELTHELNIQNILKKADDEQYAIDEAKRQEERAKVEEQFQLFQRLTSTEKENEINEAVLAAEQMQALAVGNAETEIAIQEDLEKKIAEINKKYLDAEVEATKKAEEEKQAAQEQSFNTRLQQTSQALDALGALNDAFTKKGEKQSKKQFQIQKALNLASAVVDTYGGINRALNDKTMPSTTARIVQASIVGAMGLANVLKISKTEYGNASAPSGTNMSSGGGDGGTTAPSPANFAFVGNQPNQQPPLQAYVVSTQVSSNLEAQQLINNQARLGG
jgi:hypothetical protein